MLLINLNNVSSCLLFILLSFKRSINNSCVSFTNIKQFFISLLMALHCLIFEIKTGLQNNFKALLLIIFLSINSFNSIISFDTNEL